MESTDERKEAMRSRLSANIRIWMRKTERDVAKLSADSGISGNAIYMIMRCERGASVDTITQFADAFDIPPAVLLMPVE